MATSFSVGLFARCHKRKMSFARPQSRYYLRVRIELVKEFTFEAAHLLPKLPKNHKCRRLHGHSFRVEVHVEGECNPKLGWLIDYADIAKAFAPLHAKLDHFHLNEIKGLENPTS